MTVPAPPAGGEAVWFAARGGEWASRLCARQVASPYQRYLQEGKLPSLLLLPFLLLPPQVVLTTIEPRNRPELQFDAYEYTVQSHQYTTGALHGLARPCAPCTASSAPAAPCLGSRS